MPIYILLMMVVIRYFDLLPNIGGKRFSLRQKVVGVLLAPLTLVWLIRFHPLIPPSNKEM